VTDQPLRREAESEATPKSDLDRRVLVCNYAESTNVAGAGAKAYVLLQFGGNLPERVRVLVRSRGGRWVEKWESVRRLGNPRLKTLPPDHPRHGDERLIGEAREDHLRWFVAAQSEMAARASAAPPLGGERSDT
jgi:hypothetical protein